MKYLLQRVLGWIIDFKPNRFHSLVWINGEPEIGEGTYIGGMSEVYAKGAKVKIGRNCDIASFVTINCADSSRHTLNHLEPIERLPISIGNNVFIGTHTAILGGVKIGSNSIIGAGVVLKKVNIPPNSVVYRDKSNFIIKSS